jgi:hypothetical protein
MAPRHPVEDSMLATPVAHRHRHYKTLALLVLSMTAGTSFLFWLGNLAPVTPLRGSAKAARPWTRIAVRAEAAAAGRGFFHYRIDENGRLFQSSAWKSGLHDPRRPGAILVLLTTGRHESRPTPLQQAALARLLDDLRDRHAISADQVRYDSSRALASIAPPVGRS